MYGGPDVCVAAVAFSLVLVLGNQTFLTLHNSNFLSFVINGDVVHTYVILPLPLFPGRAGRLLCGVQCFSFALCLLSVLLELCVLMYSSSHVQGNRPLLINFCIG